MDRGARQATVHGVARVGHTLMTKPMPPLYNASLAGSLNAEPQILRAYCKIILGFFNCTEGQHPTTSEVFKGQLYVFTAKFHGT